MLIEMETVLGGLLCVYILPYPGQFGFARCEHQMYVD